MSAVEGGEFTLMSTTMTETKAARQAGVMEQDVPDPQVPERRGGAGTPRGTSGMCWPSTRRPTGRAGVPYCAGRACTPG